MSKDHSCRSTGLTCGRILALQQADQAIRAQQPAVHRQSQAHGLLPARKLKPVCNERGACKWVTPTPLPMLPRALLVLACATLLAALPPLVPAACPPTLKAVAAGNRTHCLCPAPLLCAGPECAAGTVGHDRRVVGYASDCPDCSCVALTPAEGAAHGHAGGCFNACSCVVWRGWSSR